jgi:hypothetical protein
VRDARVEVWDEGLVFDTKLCTVYTDNSGYFESPALSNTDDWGTLDIYIKVYATDDYSVNVTDFSGTSYSEKTTTTSNVPDGYLEEGFPASNPISDINRRPAYFIYDKIANDAYDYLLSQVGWNNSYNLQVRWSATNNTDGTHYHPGGSIDLLVLDRWDTDVFLHEYAHFVMYKIYGDYIPPALNCQQHSWSLASSGTCAWEEGWADFLQAPIQNDSDYVDTEDQVLTIEFEAPSPPATGSDVEGAVTASLWDVFDSGVESWDTINLGINGPSSRGIWYIAQTYSPADGRGFYDQWYLHAGGNQAEVTSIFDHHLVLAPPAAPALVSPSNGQTGVSTSPTLSWTASSGTTGYDVYLGTSSPPPPSITNLSSTSYTPGPLNYGVTYYWNVVARNSSGGTASSIYSFTTVNLVSPTSLSFANQLVGTTSTAQTVTVTNSGTANLTISTVTIAGTNPGDFAKSADTCSGASVASSGTCTVSVTFTATAAGQRSATLSITDNAPDTPQSASLTGTGTDFAVSVPAGGDSATVTAGQPATYNLSIAPSAFVGTAALTCTWQGTQPRGTNCTVSPTSVNLDGANPAPFTVNVTTTARSLAGPRPDNLPPMNRRQHDVLLVVLMLGLITLIARDAPRRRKAYLGLTVSLLLAGLWVSCGGGGGGGAPPPPQTGTPAGTYSLTITSTASGVSRSTTLTLKVN